MVVEHNFIITVVFFQRILTIFQGLFLSGFRLSARHQAD